MTEALKHVEPIARDSVEDRVADALRGLIVTGQLPEGTVVISATNGKTTTAAMVASILARTGTTLVHNRAGANMAGGVATAAFALPALGFALGPLFEQRLIGLTVQVDESPGQVYDGKHSSLHPLFNK